MREMAIECSKQASKEQMQRSIWTKRERQEWKGGAGTICISRRRDKGRPVRTKDVDNPPLTFRDRNGKERFSSDPHIGNGSSRSERFDQQDAITPLSPYRAFASREP